MLCIHVKPEALREIIDSSMNIVGLTLLSTNLNT